MVNPTLIKKPDVALVPNENTKKLFQVIYREQTAESREDDDIPKIKVSSLISKMSFYYEKIRNSVDYKEERLLRKTAIERILKRQFLIEGSISLKGLKSEDIARHLLVELIRAGYLPNNEIPEEKITEIGGLIEKYVKLKDITAKAIKDKYSFIQKKEEIEERNSVFNWIVGVMASDFEDRLSDNSVAKTIVAHMFEVLSAKIKLPKNSPYQKDKDIQIYVGIYRNYLKFDQHMLGFILLKYFIATWKEYRDEDIEKIGQNISALRQSIENQIKHPLSGQLNKIISHYTVYFTVLADVIATNPTLIYNNLKNDPKSFPRDIKAVCGKRYGAASAGLWRAAVRSIIYIFLTKSIFAFLIEAPATLWFGQELNQFFLAVNIIFPPVLLFLIVLFTRLPSEKNTARIVSGVEEIAFKNSDELDPITLRTPAKRGTGISVFFGVFYFITFLMSFGLIIWALDKVGFNFVSMVIFIFFLALVSFFSIIIRRNAKEMVVVESSESIFGFVIDFFSIPIVSFGKWLSENFSRVNVFVFILDFIIEAPFKRFIEIAEEWTKYVRERKDEIE